MNTLRRKELALRDALASMQSALVAYSGGVDSSYLLSVARQVLGDSVLAVTVVSPICPRHEREEAEEFARSIGAGHELVPIDALGSDTFRANPADRCYTCKRLIFGRLVQLAEEKGIQQVVDGTNADDADDYRPGRRALAELGIRSPLSESGLTKAEIRKLAKAAGVPSWDRPSAACLASRVPYGTPIDEAILERIDRAEDGLRKLGFSQVRVRHHGPVARIELAPDEMKRALSEKTRAEMVRAAKDAGYAYAALDLQGYRTGSLNEALPGEEHKT